MTSKIKHIFALLLALTVLLGTGCQKQVELSGNTAPQSGFSNKAEQEFYGVTHATREIAGTREVSYTVSAVCTDLASLDGLMGLAACGDRLLGCGYVLAEDLTGTGQLFLADPADGTLETFGPVLGQEVSFQEAAVGPDQRIWAVVGRSYMNYDLQRYCTDYFLAAVGKDGTVEWETPLPDAVFEVEGFSYSGAFRLCFGQEGDILLDTYGGVILHFDRDGGYLGYFQPSYPIYSMAGTADGHVYIAVPGETGTVLQRVSNLGAVEAEILLEDLDGLLLLSGGDGDLLTAYGKETIVQLHGDSGQVVRTLSLADLGLSFLEIRHLCALGDCFYFLGDGQLGEGLFCLNPLETPQTRTVLSYATMDLDDPLLEAIRGFNRSSEDYVVQVWDYSEAAQGDGSRFLQALHRDILAGDAPDLANLKGVSWTGLASSGLLVDLTPWLEARREDLLPGLLDAMALDGGVYTLPSAVTLVSAYGKAALLPEEKTYESLQAAAQKAGTALFAGMDGTAYLTAFYGFGSAAGWETALRAMPEQSAEDPPYMQLRENRALLDVAEFQSFPQLHWLETYQVQAEIACFGFPDGQVDGLALRPVTETAILAGSSHQDGAWAFLEYLCGAACQSETRDGFPIRREALLARAAACIEEAGGSELSEYVKIDGTQYKAVPMTKSQADRYLQWILDAHTRYDDDPAIRAIVADELPAFLAGDKSAAETAALLEQRIALYRSE